MGEAHYYLKAEFRSEADAHAFASKLEPLAAELAKMETAWQDVRDDESTTVIERHQLLLRQFPLVAKQLTLPLPEPGEVSMNHLSGELAMTDEFNVEVSANTVTLVCDSVWHMSSWNHLQEFAFKQGARRAGWTNDEYYEDAMNLDDDEDFDPEDIDIFNSIKLETESAFRRRVRTEDARARKITSSFRSKAKSFFNRRGWHGDSPGHSLAARGQRVPWRRGRQK